MPAGNGKPTAGDLLTRSSSPPAVIPVDQSDWRPADARWLAGGKRVVAVLAVLLLLLPAIPVQIVEHGRPNFDPIPFAFHGFGDDATNTDATRASAEPPGVYWRWSVSPLAVQSWEENPRALPLWQWTHVLLPGLVALAALVGLTQSTSRRSVLLLAAGTLLLLSVTELGFSSVPFLSPELVWYEFPDRVVAVNVQLEGAPHLYQGTVLAVIIVLVGLHRAVMHGACGPLSRFASLVAGVLVGAALLFGLSGGFIHTRWSLLIEPDLSLDEFADFRVGEWVAVGLVALSRLAYLALVVFSLFLAGGAGRRMARVGFVWGVIFLAADLAVPIAEGAQTGYYVLTLTGGQYDRMLHTGILLHRLLPVAAGVVFLVSGYSRLAVSLTRGGRAGGEAAAEVPTSASVQNPSTQGAPDGRRESD
jgi:hypothetical protein